VAVAGLHVGDAKHKTPCKPSDLSAAQFGVLV